MLRNGENHMSSTDKHVNVEEIIAEIRREIKEKGLIGDDISFSDIPVRITPEIRTHSTVFGENLDKLNESCEVTAYRPLKSNRSFGFLILFIKKIIRKLTKFYIEPIVADQNENNRLTATCVHDLYYDIELLRRKVKVLEYDLNKLKEEKNQ
jgi:hypothetical protein